MTATARIISVVRGGYTDEFEATIAVHNKRGIWIGERVVAGRLHGRPFDQAFGNPGVSHLFSELSDRDLADVRAALEAAEHCGAPE